MYTKLEELIDSKEWFQNEAKYDPITEAIKVENATKVEAFICEICNEHVSCEDRFCDHMQSHYSLGIIPEPNCEEDIIKSDISSDVSSGAL